LHPKEALGIVVQFAESRVPAPAQPWLPPPGLQDPPPAVAIVGLRMRARCLERADAQWAEILQAERTTEDGALIYRWPESPMRLAVEITPDADEGALAIEYASTRAPDLPETPVPQLGTVFRRSRS